MSTPATVPTNGDVAHRQGFSFETNPHPVDSDAAASWADDWRFRHDHCLPGAADGPGGRLRPADPIPRIGEVLSHMEKQPSAASAVAVIQAAHANFRAGWLSAYAFADVIDASISVLSDDPVMKALLERPADRDADPAEVLREIADRLEYRSAPRL